MPTGIGPSSAGSASRFPKHNRAPKLVRVILERRGAELGWERTQGCYNRGAAGLRSELRVAKPSLST